MHYLEPDRVVLVILHANRSSGLVYRTIQENQRYGKLNDISFGLHFNYLCSRP
jgi:hypothetical protein